MSSENSKAKYITQAAMIAALYTVLTIVSTFIPVLGGNGIFQLRLSEALTVLPALYPAAVPGLFIGCLLSNIITGAVPVDIIFGSIATLIGAVGSMMMKKKKYLAVLPPIISNTLIIPFILRYAYGFRPIYLFFITIFTGELISAGLLGSILLTGLTKLRK